ncbi:hypothetical protein [Agrobacterium pusense]|uniref:hypothetical protein n=1 Tax=Agrobacterium pusense TaxID=648995 RepID=UPI000D19FCEE|nr:hypothetical protein [Agrobacterium pusense]
MTVPLERQKNIADVAARVREQLGLGSAATESVSSFATAAQGVKADAAVQRYISISDASGSFIGQAVKRVQTQFYNPDFLSAATLCGGGNYRRASLADLAGYPTSSFFRSLDRFMPNETIDATNGGYWVLDERRPDLTMLGAVKDGATDTWQAINDASVLGGEWLLPPGDYALLGSRTLSASNFKLRGEPAARVVVTVGTSITISGTNTSVEGIFFDSNQIVRAGVLFEIPGTRCSVSRNRFAGVFAIFIRDAGNSNQIDFNLFDDFVTCVCPIIIKGRNTKCRFNYMDDYFGFGIQALDGATDALIAYNVIKARRWEETRIAAAGQTQFTVTFSRNDVQRFGILVNGRHVAHTVDSTDSAPGTRPTVTFTLSVALVGGETVKMFAWRSLENINVNFKTRGVKVICNVCDGSGDGNIVIASGYSTSGPADYPRDMQICENICKDAAAGGIGASKSRGGIISVNTVIDAGYGLTDGTTGAQVSSLFMSGIYVPKEPGWVINGNRVVRDIGYTYYGIAFSLAGDTSYADYRGFQTRHKVGVNFIENVQERNYFAFADSSDVLRQVDIDIEDVTWTPYPESLQSLVNTSGWTSRPASTTYWTTAAIGGWTRNTANALGHPVCIETNDNSYVDCVATAFPLFANSFLRVSFTARASAAGQSGYVSLGISHTADADSGPLATVNVTDTTAKRHQITMAVNTIDNFLLRIGGAASNGKIYVTDIRLEYAPCDVG